MDTISAERLTVLVAAAAAAAAAATITITITTSIWGYRGVRLPAGDKS
jgi:hypothetical protein